MAASGDVAEIEALAGHKLVRMRVAAAAHPNAGTAVLAGLAADSSKNVRRTVAARPDTPPEALQALAADSDRATREAIAGNVATPPDVLIALLTDSTFEVRWAATMNPAADQRVQRAVCASAGQDHRFVLAQKEGLPAEITLLLARDPAKQVRGILAERIGDPAVLRTLLDDPEPDVRAAAAQNAGTTAEQRRQLVHDPAQRVRAAVVHAMADHGWDLPEEDLLLLARDRSVNVRYWVATLPGSTRPVYEILAQDPDDMTAAAARQWLMVADQLTHPENSAAQILRDIAVQGHFANPAQLGRPTPKLDEAGLQELTDRMRNPSGPSRSGPPC
ncbi:hypothetical protein [Paractinoplanes toevensis]|uniref:Leucine rich repeat variant n=1 Tax=Paractinoplanes toevensis TaxID=571911 RepID=A0A919TH21_9ACTN|nr:hypothetical protein [Actinoplanes toevensis]GIM94771.1 hypothetical protein Ato02nite_065640 [Actinoplanes toevensis]